MSDSIDIEEQLLAMADTFQAHAPHPMHQHFLTPLDIPPTGAIMHQHVPAPLAALPPPTGAIMHQHQAMVPRMSSFSTGEWQQDFDPTNFDPNDVDFERLDASFTTTQEQVQQLQPHQQVHESDKVKRRIGGCPGRDRRYNIGEYVVATLDLGKTLQLWRITDVKEQYDNEYRLPPIIEYTAFLFTKTQNIFSGMPCIASHDSSWDTRNETKNTGVILTACRKLTQDNKFPRSSLLNLHMHMKDPDYQKISDENHKKFWGTKGQGKEYGKYCNDYC